jgi:hypothetical protein
MTFTLSHKYSPRLLYLSNCVPYTKTNILQHTWKHIKNSLKLTFPAYPYPVESQNFWKLAVIGGELRKLHLLKNPVFDNIKKDYASIGKITVEDICYSMKRFFVNDDFYFEDVPKTAWEFYIGWYQPAQKWLKSRRDTC